MVIKQDRPSPFTSGTMLSVSYTFEVSSPVIEDSSIGISAWWLKNGTPLSSPEDDRIQTHAMFRTGSNTFSGSITISPLSLTLDSVSVSCVVSLESNLSYVIPSTTMTTYSLWIVGEVVTELISC